MPHDTLRPTSSEDFLDNLPRVVWGSSAEPASPSSDWGEWKAKPTPPLAGSVAVVPPPVSKACKSLLTGKWLTPKSMPAVSFPAGDWAQSVGEGSAMPERPLNSKRKAPSALIVPVPEVDSHPALGAPQKDIILLPAAGTQDEGLRKRQAHNEGELKRKQEETARLEEQAKGVERKLKRREEAREMAAINLRVEQKEKMREEALMEQEINRRAAALASEMLAQADAAVKRRRTEMVGMAGPAPPVEPPRIISSVSQSWPRGTSAALPIQRSRSGCGRGIAGRSFTSAIAVMAADARTRIQKRSFSVEPLTLPRDAAPLIS